jgi:hypothetical protein
MLESFRSEIQVAMALTGSTGLDLLTPEILENSQPPADAGSTPEPEHG